MARYCINFERHFCSLLLVLDPSFVRSGFRMNTQCVMNNLSVPKWETSFPVSGCNSTKTSWQVILTSEGELKTSPIAWRYTKAKRQAKLSKVKLRSSHLEGLAQTEQQKFHTILKSELKTIGSLSLIKMDWCGMRKTKTKDTHAKPHGKPWHWKNVRNVMWARKSKSKQTNAMGQKPKGIPATNVCYL